MAERGRPTKLTPTVQAAVVAGIRDGLPYERAAGLAGIDRATLWRWLDRGKEQASGKFFDFCNALKAAEDQAQSQLITTIRHGVPNWQARAWILERRWPEEWGNRLEIRGNKGAPLHVDLKWAHETSDNPPGPAPGADPDSD